MNCPACGSSLEKDAQFCPKCFERVEAPGLWQKFLALFQSSAAPSRRLVNLAKTVNIKTTDSSGEMHEYHSLVEAPPEVRAAMEEMKAEVMKGAGETAVSRSANGVFSRIVTQKSVSVYKINDAAGNERVYHSLEELPPEIRAVIEQAQKKGL